MMEASTPSFPSSLHPTHRPRPSSCWFKDAGAHQYLWTTSHTHTPLHHFAQKPEIASSWEWSRSRRTEGKQSAFYAHSGAHFPAESALRGSSGPPRPIKKKKRPAALWHKLSADPKQPHPLRLYFTPAVLTTMMKVVVPQSCPAHPQRATTRTTKPREEPWEEREQNQERTGEQGRGTHQSVSVVSSMTSW